MRHKFVPVSNVTRFVEAIESLDKRGAAEKQIVVVTAEPGLGKSRTGVWWGVQHDAAMVLAAPKITSGWLLSELVRELGQPARQTREARRAECVGALAARPRPIVIDEVENALADDAAALDTLRQIADLVEVPLVLLGRAHIADRLARYPQIWRRVGAIAEFQPLTRADVRLMADALVEGPVGDDVVAAVHEAYAGKVDNTLYGLGHVDAWCRTHRDRTAGLDAVGPLPEVPGGERRAGRLVDLARRRRAPAAPPAAAKAALGAQPGAHESGGAQPGALSA